MEWILQQANSTSKQQSYFGSVFIVSTIIASIIEQFTLDVDGMASCIIRKPRRISSGLTLSENWNEVNLERKNGKDENEPMRPWS